MPRAILFARSGYGNAVLSKLLAAGVEVPMIFTDSERDEGFGNALPHLGDVARSVAIPRYVDADPDNDLEIFNAIAAAKADLIVVAPYGRRVSSHVAKLARRAVALHPSLLPRYRGPSASNWAIIEGEAETGVTLLAFARQIDAGDVIAQRTVKIDRAWNDGHLRTALAEEMAALLVERLEGLLAGRPLAGTRQDERKITFYPALTRRDAHVRFDQGSDKIVARVRGVTPWPGAYTDIGGIEFEVASIEAETRVAYDDEPGRVLGIDCAASTVRIKSMDGVLCVTVRDPEARLASLTEGSGRLPFAGRLTPFNSRKFSSEAKAAYDLQRPSDEEFERYAQLPDLVVVAVAYPCNAHCPNCPYTPGNSEIRLKYGDAQFIPPALFFKIADECGQAGRLGWLPGGVGSMIRITGGGEPMLHPYGMTKLIEYAKGVGARVYLNSNGSMMQRDDIDRLLACNIDNIEISVDAGDPATYAIVRKGLDWDNLISTMEYMVARRNAMRSLSTIEVSVINQEIVAGRIEAIERFWYDLGVDNVIVRKFLTWGSATNIDPETSADPLAYLDRESGLPCPYPFHRLNIDTRGKVEVCGFDIAGRTNMGNVKEQTIREIWTGTMFTWWRDKHRAGEGGDIPLCAECPDWKYRSWEHNYRKALRNAAKRRDEAFAINP